MEHVEQLDMNLPVLRKDVSIRNGTIEKNAGNAHKCHSALTIVIEVCAQSPSKLVRIH